MNASPTQLVGTLLSHITASVINLLVINCQNCKKTAEYGKLGKFSCFFERSKAEKLSASGTSPPWSLTKGTAPGPRWGHRLQNPSPLYALRARHRSPGISYFPDSGINTADDIMTWNKLVLGYVSRPTLSMNFHWRFSRQEKLMSVVLPVRYNSTGSAVETCRSMLSYSNK